MSATNTTIAAQRYLDELASANESTEDPVLQALLQA
jgi:hypothetical protein